MWVTPPFNGAFRNDGIGMSCIGAGRRRRSEIHKDSCPRRTGQAGITFVHRRHPTIIQWRLPRRSACDAGFSAVQLLPRSIRRYLPRASRCYVGNGRSVDRETQCCNARCLSIDMDDEHGRTRGALLSSEMGPQLPTATATTAGSRRREKGSTRSTTGSDRNPQLASIHSSIHPPVPPSPPFQ